MFGDSLTLSDYSMSSVKVVVDNVTLCRDFQTLVIMNKVCVDFDHLHLISFTSIKEHFYYYADPHDCHYHQLS